MKALTGEILWGGGEVRMERKTAVSEVLKRGWGPGRRPLFLLWKVVENLHKQQLNMLDFCNTTITCHVNTNHFGAKSHFPFQC